MVVLVSPSTPAGTTITNTADVTAATADPNLDYTSRCLRFLELLSEGSSTERCRIISISGSRHKIPSV